MKKKLMIMCSLFCLLTPLTGCGKNGSPTSDTVSVDVSLVKAEVSDPDGQNFSIGDCARIVSGEGGFSPSSSPRLVVEYFTNACEITSIYMDEKKFTSFNTNNLGNNLIRVEQPIDVASDADKYVNIKVEVIKKNQSLASSKVVFSGVTMKYTTSSGPGYRELTDQEVKFPYLSKKGEIVVKKNATYPQGATSVTSDTDLNTLFYTDAVNLEYIYFNDKNDNKDEFVFQPYKLTWRKGTYNASNSLCTYSNDESSIIGDINSFNNYNINQYTCIGAVVDTTAGVDPAIKALAIDNLVKNKIYIVNTDNVDITKPYIKSCLEATEANAGVNKNCMHVLGLDSLYIDDSRVDPKTYYYGINENNNLEAISTTNIGGENKLQYAICDNAILEDGSSQSACGQSNTYVMDYEHDYLEGTDEDAVVKFNINYKSLAIAPFIDTLQPTISNDKVLYEIDSNDIAFGYSHIVQDIVPLKVDNYMITYVGNNLERDSYTPMGTNQLIPKINFSSNTITMVNQYELIFDEEAFTSDIDGEEDKVIVAMDKALESLRSNPLNLILQEGSSTIDFVNRIRLNLRGVVNGAQDHSMDVLQKYMYKLNVDETNKKVDIELALAIVEKPDDVYVKFGDKISIVCHISNVDDCLNEKLENNEKNPNYAGAAYKFMESKLSIIQGDDFSNVKDIYMGDPEDQNATDSITYVIGGGTVDVVITYTLGTGNLVAEFKEGDNIIKYIRGDEKTYVVSTIKYNQKTAVGLINQLITVDLNNKNYTITTTVDGHNLSNPDTKPILDTLKIFYKETLTESPQTSVELLDLMKGTFIDVGDNGYIFVWEETVNGDTKIHARFMDVIDGQVGAGPVYKYTDSEKNEFEIKLSEIPNNE